MVQVFQSMITVHTKKWFIHENSIIALACNGSKLSDGNLTTGSYTYTNT